MEREEFVELTIEDRMQLEAFLDTIIVLGKALNPYALQYQCEEAERLKKKLNTVEIVGID